jgi:hypothetical protein
MSFTASVNVLDETRWPITALTVMYWQDYGDGYHNPGYLQYLLPEPDAKPAESNSRATQPSRYLMLTKADPFSDPSNQEPINPQEVTFDEGHDIYWVVAWQNMHDPAIYYLVQDPTIWEKLEEDAFLALNKALGDMLDFCTDSDVGRVVTKAADYYVKSVYDSRSYKLRIENKINTDPGKSTLTITLNGDRATGSIESPNHSTACSMRFYLKDAQNQF